MATPFSKETRRSVADKSLERVKNMEESDRNKFILKWLDMPSSRLMQLSIGEPFKTRLLTMQMMKQQSDQNSDFQMFFEAWLTLFVQKEAINSMSESLESDAWSSESLSLLCDAVNIEMPSSPIVRLEIQKGKINWFIRDRNNVWWSPSKTIIGNLTQEAVKLESEPKKGRYWTDMSPEEFIRFKRGGKLNAQLKILKFGYQILLERLSIDRSKLQKWDVTEFKLIVKVERDPALEKDHIPQDQWKFQVHYDRQESVQALRSLKLISNSDVSPDEVRVHVKGLRAVPQSTIDLFPVIRTDLPELISSAFTHFKIIGARKTYESNLAEVRSKWKDVSLDNYEKALKDLKTEIRENGITIAVPADMHKCSRTFGLSGLVREARLVDDFDFGKVV